MSLDKCPCGDCTPETGRGPGCHNKDCPRGWYEWDQRQQARRQERAMRSMTSRTARKGFLNK